MKYTVIGVLITAIIIVSCLFIQHKIYAHSSSAEISYENSHGTADICGKDLSLSDSYGHSFSTQNLKGKYALIYFGFTTCTKTCPVAMHNITLALNALPKKTVNKIQPIFITLDPENDNNKALNAYIKNYHKNFIALTGTQKQLQEAKSSCKVYSEKINNELVHSSLIYLLDKDGKYLASFVYDDDPTEIAKSLQEIAK